MNPACFFQNTALHEQIQHASCIRPLKNNFVRTKIIRISSIATGVFISHPHPYSKQLFRNWLCLMFSLVLTTTGVSSYVLGQTITVSSVNPSVSDANVYQGMTKHRIYRFTTSVTAANALLTSLTFTTEGTYTPSDVTKFQLWYSAASSLETASQIGSVTTSLGTGTHTFSGFSQTIVPGTIGYFWITMAVSTTATNGHTIRVNALTQSNLTFAATGFKTVDTYDGGWQIIQVNVDTDGDGISDIYDLDTDNDGIPNDIENNCSTQEELFSNGDFSAGNTSFLSGYSYQDPSRGGWLPEGDYSIVSNPQKVHPYFPACPDHTSGSGNMMVINGNSKAAAIVWSSGAITVTPFTNYILSFYLSSEAGENPARLIFKVNDEDIGLRFNATSSTCNWTHFATIWNSGNLTSAKFDIINLNTIQSGNDFALDDISCKYWLKCDADGDGIPDMLDLDSDNDGIYDVVEAGGADANNDGIIDNFTDNDKDGLSDNVDNINAGQSSEVTNGTPLANPDTDGDNVPDRIDPDSDGDGCDDVREAGFTDPDNDGLLGTSPLTINSHGVVTSAAGYTAPADADANGVKDYLQAKPSFTTQPKDVSLCMPSAASCTFSVAAVNTRGTYQWQVSTDKGINWTNLTDGEVYSHVNTATLSLTGVTASYNDYRYRVIINNPAYACSPITSDSATLTTIQTPIINTITGTTICCGNSFSIVPVDGTNGTVPANTTYSWNAPVVTGISGATSGTSLSGISGSLINTTYADIDVTYTVTPTNSTCVGDPFAIIVKVLADPPVITSNEGKATAAVSVYENTTAVTTVTATDINTTQPLTYTISGTDADKFTINPQTGVLTFKTAPDYELPTDNGANNVYNITVTVSDGTLTDTQDIAVTVLDVVEPIIIIDSYNPAVSDANVYKEMTKHRIYRFTTSVTAANAILTSLTFTTEGTYTPSDVTTFQLWYSAANSLETASQIGSVTTSLGTGTHTFSGFSQTIVPGTIGYFWITMAVSTTPTNGHTIRVNALTQSNLTFTVAESKTVNTFDGGWQIIQVMTDTDGDGIFDIYDLDTDNDGIPNDIENNCSTQKEFFSNGDFSAGNTSFFSGYWYQDPSRGGNLYPAGTYAIVPNPHIVHDGFSSCTDHTSGSGNMMVVNGDPTPNGIVWSSNTITIEPFKDYILSFYITSVVSISPAQLMFNVNGKDIGLRLNATSSTCNWTHLATIWNSGNLTSAKFDIINLNTIENGNDFALDDISCKYWLKCDADGDGIPDMLDLDSDNDGIYDVVEAGGTDANNDGIIDNFTDKDKDGLSDNVDNINAGKSGEVTNGTPLANSDTDRDDVPNRIDPDSDGDGCDDVREAGFTDPDNDGLLGTSPVTINSHGVVTSAAGYTAPADADANGVKDYLQAKPSFRIQPRDVSLCMPSATSCTFSVAAVNTRGTYQWQVSTDKGNKWNNLTDGEVYSHVNTATLSLTWVTASYNDYRYRVLMNNPAYACSPIISDSATLTIINSPVITATDQTVPENTIRVETVTATDADAGDILTFSISDGVDRALFTIDTQTGVLTFKTAPNYESPADADKDNVYKLTVSVTDAAGHNRSKAINITVTDVMETTSFSINPIPNTSIPENTTYTSVTPSINGSPIGTLTYFIDQSKGDGTLFTINPATGVVTLSGKDFENPSDANSDNVYEVTIIAIDDDGNSDSEGWTVTITNVKESIEQQPPVILDSNNTPADTLNFHIPENETTKICLNVSDPNNDDTFISKLNLISGSGTITLNSDNKRCFNYTPTQNFAGNKTLFVRVCDTGSPSMCDSAIIVINIIPRLVIPQTLSPNGDGMNDTWVIEGMVHFPKNKVTISTRWGDIVYKATGYDNEKVVWNGKYNIGYLSGTEAPNGTYFYIIELENHSKLKGFIVLNQ